MRQQQPFIIVVLIGLSILLNTSFSDAQNAPHSLVAMKDASTAQLDPLDYQFLTTVLGNGRFNDIATFTAVYTLDLQLPVGHVFIGEYEIRTNQVSEDGFVAFIQEEHGKFRVILNSPNAHTFFQDLWPEIPKTSRFVFYLHDIDRDGMTELLQFAVNDEGEILERVFGYDRQLGYFVSWNARAVSRREYELMLPEGAQQRGAYDWSGAIHDLADLLISPPDHIEYLPRVAEKVKDGVWDLSEKYLLSPQSDKEPALHFLKAHYDTRSTTSPHENVYTITAKLLKPGDYKFSFKLYQDATWTQSHEVFLKVSNNSSQQQKSLTIRPVRGSLSTRLSGYVDDSLRISWTTSKQYNGMTGSHWEYAGWTFDERMTTSYQEGDPVLHYAKIRFGEQNLVYEEDIQAFIRSAEKMFFYDEITQEYYIRDTGSFAGIAWSPDAQKVLLVLHYGSSEKLRQHVPYLNYAISRNIPIGEGLEDAVSLQEEDIEKSEACALLIIDTTRKTITPFVLPFLVERLPQSVTWWDNTSFVMVGDVIENILTNQWLTSAPGLTVINLLDKSVATVPIPYEQLGNRGETIDYFSTVRKHHQLGLVAVSFWRSEVAGGDEGTIFFAPGGSRVRFAENLDRNWLRDAVETPQGYLTEGGFYHIQSDTFETQKDMQLSPTFQATEAQSPDGKRAQFHKFRRQRQLEGETNRDLTRHDGYVIITK